VRSATLAFLAGVLLLQTRPELPPTLQLCIAVALSAAGALASRFARIAAASQILLMLAAALLGFAWSAGVATHRLAQQLPVAWEGRDIELIGVIVGLPQQTQRGLRFRLQVEQALTPQAPIAGEVLLTWYPERASGAVAGTTLPTLTPGDRWRLTVRLRRPHGFANRHGFEFELWALERGLRATGYVRATADMGEARLAEDVGGPMASIDRLRDRARTAIRAQLGDAPLCGVLIALVVGDQSAIPPEQWQVFWRTGVGHLMSISGLHITMLAGLAFALAYALWVRLPGAALGLPARKVAAAAGLAAALGYALIAGFSVPTQRTFYMLLAVGIALWGDRNTSPSRVLAFAALVVAVLDPWAVLATGFWLSFGAVAAMFYIGSVRIARAGKWVGGAQAQLAIGVLMLPATLLLFQEVSLVSPLANAAAIPLVSLGVVPLALAGVLLPPLLDLAQAVMALTFWPLERLAQWPDATWQSHAPPPWSGVLAAIGGIWLLAPRAVPLRPAGVLLFLPMFLIRPAGPEPGEAWIDLLDVGQGLATVVRTARHTLVYDTGATFAGDSDAGSRVIVPFLRGEGRRTLDLLIVSHDDDDHFGGAVSVIRARKPNALVSTLPANHRAVLAAQAVGAGVSTCAAGQEWSWDGVHFAFLHPREDHFAAADNRRTNDMSCVLEITTAGVNAIFTADIEARSERELVVRYAKALQADLLVVPHHGSKTSSTDAFLDLVRPDVALLPVGYRNRFSHPHPDVLARYAERGIPVYRTDQGGALQARLSARDGVISVRQHRVEKPRYWWARPPQGRTTE
jgi:competence protein ComEC